MLSKTLQLWYSTKILLLLTLKCLYSYFQYDWFQLVFGLLYLSSRTHYFFISLKFLTLMYSSASTSSFSKLSIPTTPILGLNISSFVIVHVLPSLVNTCTALSAISSFLKFITNSSSFLLLTIFVWIVLSFIR